jgi:putative transposase
VGQHRSTNRYVATVPDFEEKLVARTTALAEQHPRWGYRMIQNLLVEEGWQVALKRVHRLWRQEGLQVPPQRLKSSGGKAIGEAATARRTRRRSTAIMCGPMTS